MKIDFDHRLGVYVAFRSEDDVCVTSSHAEALAFLNEEQELSLVPMT